MNNPFHSPSLKTFLQNLRLARLYSLARRGEVGLVLLGIIVGVTSGCAVAFVSMLSRLLHATVFDIGISDRLSGIEPTNKLVLLVAPAVGGAVLGLFLYILAKRHKRPMVDPIEANALHGGQLSLTDSVIVTIQNVISNGFGASVGLEAGYTQIAAGIASRIGIQFRLRRADLRILLGCGAAGAIAAAFNAPLTGAFYAFELIIGSYTIVSLSPVVVSALVANLVARQIAGDHFTIDVGDFGNVVPADYVPAILLGILSGGFGILLMQGVAGVEQIARKSSIAIPFRPVLGGVVVGLLAFLTPQVLSSGHGALHLNLAHEVAIPALIGLVLLKAVASAVSIGSGFRGGLFFASLFMGALVGKLFAYSAPYFVHSTLTPVVYAVVGMSCLAVAVIGGPLTMTFLALELTGDFSISALVLAASISTSLLVRSTFGYSFATWRFHLRGESIRSAHDIGWIRNLTVDKLMRADVRTAEVSMLLDDFRKKFPLGSTQRVIMTGDNGKYAGIILVPEAHASLVDVEENQALDRFIRYRGDFLLSTMNAKQAAALFDKTGSEALAVLNGVVERQVIGLLTESHTLRRYSEELDRRRREASGEL